MNEKLQKMARVGFIAKGLVYGITGILTFLAAFNLGGKKAGKMQVLEFLEKQTFGNILLVIMAVGLICYAAWRLTQAIKDPENIGTDKKGKVKRAAFFGSGLLYLGIAAMAVLKAVGSSKGNTSGGGQKTAFLATEIGLWILALGGIGIIGAGIFQFVKAYKNDYFKKFDLSSLKDPKKRKTVAKTAEFGLIARGVIFTIIGIFAVIASVQANPDKIKTTQDVFSFLQDSSYGAYFMALVAAGLVAYAGYMFLMAKFRRFAV